MKLKLLTINKTETQAIDLPIQFYEPVRTDLIQRAFLAIQSNKRQPYGADPEAGKRASAVLSRRRRKYRGAYGFGISRVPRKILSRRGTRMNWVGAFAPGTVGGRRAHPPKAEKSWSQKINKTERRKAIRSALAATINTELVKNRGHLPPKNYPFIIEDKINEIKHTKKLRGVLAKIGFKEELEKTKAKNKKGLLLVTTTEELKKVGSNIPGFESEKASNLNVEILAPGGVPGRLTIFTKSAMKELVEKKLFTKEYKGETKEKSETPKKTKQEKKITEKESEKQEVKHQKKEPAKNKEK
ncbi:MAG: 50S ribosomal protein L4 [DPANN group archaeon]|nr:50S ribosomal protein L4 [DPANN group archaeon]